MVKYALALSMLAGAVAALPAAPGVGSQAPPSLPNADPAAIMSVPQSSVKSYQTGGLVRYNVTESSQLSKRWDCSTSPTLTWGDTDTGGPGITIDNDATDWRGFYFYHNSCDSIPWKYIWIAAKSTQFVSVPTGWEGRVQRGVDATMLDGQPQLLGSWLEISWDAKNGNTGWADISLIRGNDGGILVWNDNGDWKGFTQWVLDGAPDGAYDMKNDGQWVIKYTENTDGSINTIPRDWDIQEIGSQYVYVDDAHGSPVISTPNQRFSTFWPDGRA
ncbi:hypothetical protein EIK77_005364 [Talaromyces pinophilus]|jgi:hypothetical protein|nr:hypothetical protein EIK77_005364 [Talaromyces pinophilus]PCH09532.1 Hypothetical protein PENO1_000600 [Penicillium occitanis (nom. inval.)]